MFSTELDPAEELLAWTYPAVREVESSISPDLQGEPEDPTNPVLAPKIARRQAPNLPTTLAVPLKEKAKPRTGGGQALAQGGKGG